MKIVFEDGEAQECAPTGQRNIAQAEVVHPPQRIPKHLKRVWDKPPTYANLIVVRCDNIQPDHHVMTASGLKLVVRVERE